jgi:putative flippase GtrA
VGRAGDAGSLARAVAVLGNRAVQALKSPDNWVQLAKFGVVGGLGYAINLGVYDLLLGIGAHAAAVVSYIVAAVSNYWWNRHWTFAQNKGGFGSQGAKFFAVSAVALGVNQLWLLVFLDWLHLGKLEAQAISILLVLPLNFLGNKLWSFRR